MKSLSRALAIAGLAAPAAAFAIAAQAQPAGGPPPGDYPPSQGGQGYGQPPSPQQMAQSLRKRLTLRPDQEASLQDFVRNVAPPPGFQEKMYRQQQEARSMTTPQRMDLMVSNIDEMRQMMQARAQATKAFYAQLTPDQKRAFDAMGAQGDGM
jgi:protein CpxP